MPLRHLLFQADSLSGYDKRDLLKKGSPCRHPRQITASTSDPPRRKRNSSSNRIRVSRKKIRMLSSRGHQESERMPPRENGEVPRFLPKTSSEPEMPSSRTLAKFMDLKLDLEQNVQAVWQFDVTEASMRRCMTESNIRNPSGSQGLTTQSPDLVQLFNIFQRNTPEPVPARMLVTVTLVGSIQAIRVIVGYNALVKDVIKASLKAYAKEGRLPRKGCTAEDFGLHYSQFCLESLNPEDPVRDLGTRSFFLYPSRQQQNSDASESSQASRVVKPWWNIWDLIFT